MRRAGMMLIRLLYSDHTHVEFMISQLQSIYLRLYVGVLVVLAFWHHEGRST